MTRKSESSIYDFEVMDLFSFKSTVEGLPLPTLPGDAERGFYGPLWEWAAGRNRWRLIAGVWRVHADGEVDLFPPGFSYDKRSGNNFTHAIFPRSVGRQDRCWCGHDLARRARVLMGRSLRRVDLTEFYDMMIDDDKTRGSAWTQSRTVYVVARLGVVGDGLGWHGSPGAADAYDTPVYDHEDGLWKPLPVWTRDHYTGDGSGYRCMRSRLGGLAWA